MSSKVTFSTDSTDATARDFFVLLKPGVMLLVVYTAAIGLLRAPETLHPFLTLIVIFSIALGSGGAAAFNMWYDRDIDQHMKRTRNRPIPQGKISPDDALTFGILLSLTSVFILYLATNLLAAGLLAFSIFFYAYIYTVLLKRRTPQNIVIGGAAGAFPPLIGWAAATNTILAWEPWLLFAIIFIWTPSHFWALALYRSEEYAAVNIPMMPTIAGPDSTKRQIFLYSVLLVIASLTPASLQPLPFYTGAASLLGLLYLILAGRLLVSDHPRDAMRLFSYSILYLFLLFSALLVENYFK
jgi:protoheme IX farnesyltransferase